MIIKIISNNEFIVLQALFEEKYRKLEAISAATKAFFETHDQKLYSLNSMYQKLSDPAIQIVEDLNESDILIEEKIRKYIPKYMGPNTIWGKWIPFTSVKSTISLSNFDCVHMKMKPDLPKLKLRSTKYPTNTGKMFNAKNVTLKEEKPVKLAVGKKSLELFFETKSVKILNTQVKAVLLRNRRQMPTAI